MTGNIKEDFELCPPGYHLPSDGYTDQVSYNGVYPNFNLVESVEQPVIIYPCDYEGNAATPFDHKAQIEYSEWRQSMWLNPVAGDIGSWTGPLRLYPDRTVQRYVTSPDYSGNVDDENLKQRIGFYADGYFDRRPIRYQPDGNSPTTRYAVSPETAQAAYRGSLIFNPITKASVFLPAAGRRSSNYELGMLHYPGETGYYWTSSASAEFQNTENSNAWTQEYNSWRPGSISTPSLNASSIRCVRD